MNPKRYPEFDGLRGLLALWVALAHTLCWCGYGRLSGEGKGAKLWAMFTGAEAAAETFIVLSGFAIATLLQREQVGYGRYMLRRAFRIYPVYFVALVLAIWLAPATGMIINSVSWSGDYYMDWQRAAQMHQDAHWSAHVWSHLLLVHGLVPKPLLDGVSATFLMPAWSIGLEEQFYLVAPLLLWMLRRSWGLIVVLGLALAGQVLQPWWNNPANASLPYWLPYFLVGIGSSYVATWMEKQPETNDGKLSGVIAFGLLVAALFLAKNPLPLLIWGVVCPVALGAWRGFAPSLGALIGRLLSNPFARWIGDVSYSLYLIHWPLIIMLLGLLYQYQPAMPKPVVLLFMMTVGLSVMLVLAWALHLAVERPFMGLGRRLANRPERLPVLPAIPALKSNEV